MNREQALDQFWNSFDVPAYDSTTVPDARDLEEMGINPFPRITYEVSINEFGTPTTFYVSLWDKNTSWARITELSHEIEEKLSDGGYVVRYDGGVAWLKKGTPFMQRMGEEDDSIRRIIMNVEIEYLEGRK